MKNTPILKRIAASLAILCFAWQGMAPSVHAAGPENGTIVRSPSDPRVWYVEHSNRRWIETEAAFKAQGFRWTDVRVIAPEELNSLPIGAPIKPETLIIMPSERPYLGDLAPFAAEDVRVVREGGKVKLKFTTSVWNRGQRAVEIRTATGIDTSRDATYDAFQRMWQEGGTYRDREVGSMYWHAPHDHYHYIGFANYALRFVRVASTTADETPLRTQKTTFCLRDDAVGRMTPEGPKQARTYITCNSGRQGISVGWNDVYPYTLPDQYFDVTGLEKGLYEIRFDVDPDERFAEMDRINNASIALLDINPAVPSVRVVAFAAPFANSWNKYPEGHLVKALGDNRVYMVNGNRKRWIRTEAVFKSYGRPWGDIFEWPKPLVDAIPNNVLVRQAGTNGIYVVNDAGLKRRVLTPTVMSSYGWTSASVTDISDVELVSYPNAEFVRREGSSDIWSISQRKIVDASGIDPASIHVINQTDFDAYGF